MTCDFPKVIFVKNEILHFCLSVKIEILKFLEGDNYEISQIDTFWHILLIDSVEGDQQKSINGTLSFLLTWLEPILHTFCSDGRKNVIELN